MQCVSYRVMCVFSHPPTACTRHVSFGSAKLMGRLEEVSPWKSTSEDSLSYDPPDAYVAWHMRTVDPADRAQGYKANVHTYMITEPSTVVCPVYHNATTAFRASCPSLFPEDIDVYLSANRFEIQRGF